jgi:alpha-D-ribose 1-methylphosphonate 5-triphosphate synthase subunit PhnG
VDDIQVESPPGAYNWVIGTKGRHINPQLGITDAYYQSPNRPVEPSSLYEEQLKERLAAKDQSAAR